MIESVMTASLQAQLKAKMAPGPLVVTDDGVPPPPPAAPLAPDSELGRTEPLLDVSVLSHNF